MANRIHDNADRIQALFAEVTGEPVSDVCRSTNRNGDHSAYFNWRGRIFRVSDHSIESVRRTEIQIDVDMTREQVVDFVARALVLDAEATKVRQAEDAARFAAAAARQAELKAVAEASERRKTAWNAFAAQNVPAGATATAASKVEKAWRKENPIEAFM